MKYNHILWNHFHLLLQTRTSLAVCLSQLKCPYTIGVVGDLSFPHKMLVTDQYLPESLLRTFHPLLPENGQTSSCKYNWSYFLGNVVT